MEVEVSFEARYRTISVGALYQGLDDAVDAFAVRVRDAVNEVGQHLRKMVLEHTGNLLHGFEFAAHGVAVPHGKRKRPVDTMVGSGWAGGKGVWRD